MSTTNHGTERIEAERQRQIAVEGWTPAHDDTHTKGELFKAAHCYEWHSRTLLMRGRNCKNPPPGWPWEIAAWKPSNDPARTLEKAGALYLAEAARCLRAGLHAQRIDGERRAASCAEQIDAISGSRK